MTGEEQLKAALRICIVLLCAGAAVLLVVVAGSDRWDGTSGKVLATAVLIAFLGLPVGAGTREISCQPRIAAIGYLTILVAGAALILGFDRIWRGAFLGSSNADHWLWYTIIGSLALGITSMLLGDHDDRDRDSVKLIRGLTAFAVFALFVTVIAEVRTPGQQVDPRLSGYVAIAFGLGMLLLPLLRLLTRDSGLAGKGPGAVRLDHAVIAVSERERSDRFYRQVLGAQVEEDAEGRVAYRIGAQRLNVHHPGRSASPLAAAPVTPGNSDLCFVWPGPSEDAIRHLRSRGVEIVEGPVIREGAAGLGVSVYCRDPDGSLIELVSYR